MSTSGIDSNSFHFFLEVKAPVEISINFVFIDACNGDKVDLMLIAQQIRI